MECYEGFKWAIPKGFKDAVANCFFEEGDMLYNTPLAYEGKWGDAVDKIEHAIQVQLPKFGTMPKTTAEEKSIFKSNWNSIVKIRFAIGGGEYEKQVLNTTQGRLFTFLRTGNFAILNQEIPPPLPPLLAPELQKFLKDEAIIDVIKNKITGKYDKPNIIIMAHDETSSLFIEKFQSVKSCLYEFNPIVIDLNLSDFSNLNKYDFHPVLSVKVMVIDSSSPEKIRDKIKERLWPKGESKDKTKSFCDVITKTQNTSVNSFKLENHLIFIPFQIKNFGQIRVHSFSHAPIYRYRLHTTKIESKSNIPKSLINYLQLVFTDCPNHLFVKTGSRVSKLDIKMNVKLQHYEKHTLINLAKQSRKFDAFKSRHENLQQYFLENDKATIAAELPLWIESRELKDFNKVFNVEKALTGHIDILRLEDDGKIAIWDYKPNAYKETKAHKQVFLYTYMLAVRTGISLSNFTCGYFDETDLYQFNPVSAVMDA